MANEQNPYPLVDRKKFEKNYKHYSEYCNNLDIDPSSFSGAYWGMKMVELFSTDAFFKEITVYAQSALAPAPQVLQKMELDFMGELLAFMQDKAIWENDDLELAVLIAKISVRKTRLRDMLNTTVEFVDPANRVFKVK